MSNGEFLVLVAGIVGILIARMQCSASISQQRRAVAFTIVVIVGLGVVGEYAMPDGEFERMISDIWGPIFADIRHLSERAMH